MNTSSINKGNKTTVHVQLVSRRHQRQIAQREKINTSVLKVHSLNHINATASTVQQ